MSGLTFKHVTNWFKNRRHMKRKAEKNKKDVTNGEDKIYGFKV